MSYAFFVLALLTAPFSAQQIEKVSGRLARDPESGGQVAGFAFTPDWARVVFVADLAQENEVQLWSVPFAGGTPVALSSLSATGGAFEYRCTPGSDRVVYYTDQDQANQYELYAAALDGCGAPLRLNQTLPSGRDTCADFRVTSTDVVYRADVLVANHFELFRAPLDAGSAPVRLSAPMVAGGSLGLAYQRDVFELTPAGDRAVYLADALVDGRIELFSVPVDGSASAVRLN